MQRLLMRQVLAQDDPLAAAKARLAMLPFVFMIIITFEQDILAERHYMQRGSGSNIVLGEADGLNDAAAACLAVGLLAKFARDN